MDPTFAFVPQDDIHCPQFTVEETLQFAAMLRKRQTNIACVNESVAETMKILGLSHIAKNYVGVIGNSEISRGQLRRLSIAVEIVDSPSMIFLDEPTTGYRLSTIAFYFLLLFVLKLQVWTAT